MTTDLRIHCKYDELKHPSELKPHPDNANSHPQNQIERLAKILEYQGWRYPVKVSKQTGFITSGHGRVLAAHRLGLDKVPVNYQDYTDEDQERADLHADNAIASWADLDLSKVNLQIPAFDPSFDIDLLGIKDFTLDVAEKEGEDEVPEDVPATTKLGDLYILGDHRLLCGDSTDLKQVERLMNGEKADMVFTDPPYGVGINYKTHDDNDLTKYFDLMNGWFSVAKEIGCFIAATVGYKNNNWWFKNYPPDSFLVWFDKTKQSPHSHAYLCKTELILLWGRPSERYSWDFIDVTHDRSKDGSENHPCPKPVKLIEEILRPECPNILDFFGGSGSTLIACEKTNRKCFMMEIDPHYCDVIVARWEKYTGKKAVLDGQG